jgi:hypothetical protein
VAVADALVPFIPSLLAMGHRDRAINAFMSYLGQILAPLRPVMIFLDGDAGTALTRAAAREDPGWLDWYVSKPRYQVNPPVHDAPSAARYLRRERGHPPRGQTPQLGPHHHRERQQPEPRPGAAAAIRELTPRIARHQSSPAITRQTSSPPTAANRNDLRLEY